MIPRGKRSVKIFLFYLMDRDNPQEDICFETGMAHFTEEVNPLETITRFIRDVVPELFFSQMTEIGKITKPIGKFQLLGFVFTLKDPETAYPTGVKSEVFVALSELEGVATPEEVYYSLSLFKNSPWFILENYKTFSSGESGIDAVLEKMRMAVPRTWGNS